MNKLTLLKSKHPEGIMTTHYQSQFIKSFGIWMDGDCSWLSSKEWDLSPKFVRESALSILVAYHKRWGIQITVLQENSPTGNESVMTLILKNQTECKKEMKFVSHFQHIGEITKNISLVSPLEHAIVQHNSQLTLVSARFNREKESQLAVGKKKTIWYEREGRLALAPLCCDGHESMIVTKMELEPWQETYGRIWEISGHSEQEIYEKHDKHKMYDHLKRAAERML